jgi:hypothetical protein
MLIHYALPRDLVAQPQEIALVWLGGNDAGNAQPLSLFERHARELSNLLAARGFVVVFALPPDFPWVDVGPYREILKRLNVVVLDPPWHLVSTVDGLHPTCAGHTALAWWFEIALKRRVLPRTGF